MIDNLNDIGGIRVICPFIEDIYTVADMLMRQDDLTLIEKKRLHCQSQAERLPQPASDPRGADFPRGTHAAGTHRAADSHDGDGFLGQPGHQLRYKSDVEIPEHMSDDLKKCADVIAETDQEMQRIAKRTESAVKGEIMQYIPIITLVLVVILLGLVIVLLTRKPEKPELPQQIDPTASITALGTLVTQNLREGREAQSNQLSAMDKSLGDKMSGLTDQLGRFETRLQGFYGGNNAESD